jgi:hypothetical protein
MVSSIALIKNECKKYPILRALPKIKHQHGKQMKRKTLVFPTKERKKEQAHFIFSECLTFCGGKFIVHNLPFKCNQKNYLLMLYV